MLCPGDRIWSHIGGVSETVATAVGPAEEGTGVGSILGNRVTRVEDPRFLTGGGDYVDAIRFPDEAYCAYVRSPYAHATIESIDVGDARRGAGRAARVHRRRLDSAQPDAAQPAGTAAAMNRPFLAADRVRFVGEAVVAVVAETQAAAVDAAELVLVDYEPLPAVVDVEQSATDELLIFPEAGIERRDEARDARAGRLRRM